ATQGRSLGVHLVLATQRPSGVVSAELRANVTVRLALRVTDAADSSDVLDVPDAARIPSSRPGRALLRRGPGPVEELQVALVGPAEPPVRWVDDSGCGPSIASGLEPRGSNRDLAPATDLEPEAEPDAALVSEVIEAARRWSPGAPRPRAPWLEALPGSLPAEALPAAPRGTLALSLADVPEAQSREPAAWD